jgi:AcrR family transcriptional regulator
MTQVEEHLTRDERRRRSEVAILDAAREQFATGGFDRTTIRSVAAAAGVDPALVMQYYGNKERLFAESSVRWLRDRKTSTPVPVEQLPRQALEDVFASFEDPEVRAAATALIRNCLTHPAAAAIMRDEVMSESQDAMACVIQGEDADLRAGAMAACVFGMMLARYVMEIPVVADADPADLIRVMEPALRAILSPDGARAGSAEQ